MDTFTLFGILVICLVILGMTAAIIVNNANTKKQRALAVIRGQSFGDAQPGTARDEQERRRAEIAKKLKEKTDGEDKKKKATIAAMLEQAGLSVSVRKFWLFSLLFAILCGGGAALAGMSPLVACFLFITGLLGVPRMFVKNRIKRRQKKFLMEFADALEAMVRLLKAGMPITEAIAMAAREFEGPVSEEMTRIYEAQKVGISLPEAALSAARRMPITEMQMFATGLAIQSQTGSSLSEVLLNLAKVIRARFRLKRKVQALSAEAKASAMIIGSLPFLIGSGLYFINPEYMDPLFFSTTGRFLMAASAVWMGMGIFVMKAMINFKV